MDLFKANLGLVISALYVNLPEAILRSVRSCMQAVHSLVAVYLFLYTLCGFDKSGILLLICQKLHFNLEEAITGKVTGFRVYQVKALLHRYPRGHLLKSVSGRPVF